jgi:hypothetical protein
VSVAKKRRERRRRRKGCTGFGVKISEQNYLQKKGWEKKFLRLAAQWIFWKVTSICLQQN